MTNKQATTTSFDTASSFDKSSGGSAAPLRRRLMIATWLAEATVIATCAWTAFRLAGSDWGVAAPLLAVSALEATRVPLSSYATRLKPLARVAAFAALAGIGVLTAEVMSLGFEIMIAGRVAGVTEARSELDKARGTVAARQDKIAQLTAEANAARASLAALASAKPDMVQIRSQTCSSKRGSYDCTPRSAAQTNQAAIAGYNARLTLAQDAATRAQDRLAAVPEGKDAQDSLRDSEARYRGAIAASPMTRLAAELFGVEPENLSDASFERFKGWVAVSLGAATAFTTALLAFLAHTQTRDPAAESRLARALRAMLAARRKTLRRLKETVRVETKERVRFVYVPTDPATGRVLDPDMPRG
jgi:hypothetical protein